MRHQLAVACLHFMESEDHGRGGRQHHCHHHDHPDHKEQRHTRAKGNRGRHIHGDVGVLPDKDCPSRCRERQKQTQYDVALKQNWISVVFYAQGAIVRDISSLSSHGRFRHRLAGSERKL